MGRGEASRLDHSRRPYDGQLRVSVRGSDVPSRAAFAYFAASAFQSRGGISSGLCEICLQEREKYIYSWSRHAQDNIRA